MSTEYNLTEPGYKYGWAGDEKFFASGGEHKIFGNDGTDILIKPEGTGYFNGGAGFDWLSYTTSSVGVGVYLNQGIVSSAKTKLEFQSVEGVEGSQHADYIVGHWGDETLVGFGGGDHLIGNQGNDLLLGVNGNDYLEGGSGVDSLYGQDDNDHLFGGAGDDYLFGGDGKDRLQGGDGDDKFFFYADETGDIFRDEADMIVDFEAGDSIHIPRGLNFAGDTLAPGLGQYGVWDRGDAEVITWRDADGFHDIEVFGDSPIGAIFSDTNDYWA